MMQGVTLPLSKLIGVPLIGIAVLFIQSGSDLSTIPMALMIALAAMIHLAAMALRDAEFRALTTAHGLNRRDIISYGAMTLFDALLLFGLVTGAGLLQDWQVFVSIAALIALILPVAVFFLCRGHYAPENARPMAVMARLTPPVFLLILIVLLYSFQSLQSPSGSQPYSSLVLLSALVTATDPATRFAGAARFLRLGVLGATLILVTWNYLNIA